MPGPKSVPLPSPSAVRLNPRSETKWSSHTLLSVFTISTPQIINRYCHLHPATNKDALSNLLSKDIYKLRWAGSVRPLFGWNDLA